MNTDQYSKNHYIERLSQCKLVDLHKLHKAVYGIAVRAQFYQDKYDTAYTGIRYAGFIAYNVFKEPVAYYGVIPCFLNIDGKKVLSAQSADTMTHPDYRKKGLFVELANLTFDLCKKEQINLIFGFPNQNSMHGFIKNLGWKVTGEMNCFIIPVKAIPVEKIAQKAPFLKRLYKFYTNKLLNKYEVHAQVNTGSVPGSGFNGVLRDSDYLQYKTYSEGKFIKIADAYTWIKIDNGLMIGDIWGLDNNFDRVINKLYRLAQLLGLRQMQFHSSKGNVLHTFFSERYKAIQSFPVIFKDMGSDHDTEKIKFTFADIDIF